MNERIKKLAEQAGFNVTASEQQHNGQILRNSLERLTESIVRECVNKIETYQIPVGNSAAGEMACEWTYDALKEIRDDIKETFGVEE